MARIIMGSYFVRYPLGGIVSWAIQYLTGMKENGHEVYFVEKYGYDNSCYNPVSKTMSDDPSYGLNVISEIMKRCGFEDKWCFVEKGDIYHGISRKKIDEIFSTADLYIDMGAHGSWNEEAENSGIRVLIDGEPAFTQMKWSNFAETGKPVPVYDHYFTNGFNLGKPGNPAPTLGLQWGHIFNPVNTSLHSITPSAKGSPYSTVMNWQSHDPILYKGRMYGQKDIEFEKFISLPLKLDAKMEVAVSGINVPVQQLMQNKWKIADAQEITISYDSFIDYIHYCRGEFSVCKNIFIENRNGWFSDKSAAFLASGRPVVLQDTGFSEHLPTGDGLFAVNNIEEAIHAIEEIESDYEWHSQNAREIACEFLDAKKVMGNFLSKLNLQSEIQ